MKRIFLIILGLICTLLSTTSIATNPKPLPANEAFQFSATAKNYQTMLVSWKMAPGYYLYKKHFHFKVIKPKKVQLGDPLYPYGDTTLKTALGNFQVYSNSLTIPIPIIDATEKRVVLQVHYQGCSRAGYCYPPINKLVSIDLAGNYMRPVYGLNIDVAPTLKTKITTVKIPKNRIAKLLDGKNIWMLILGFFGFGVLISLTPCVLPMIPILSSMILGKKHMSHAHAFSLSLFYVLGMALTYAIAGVLFGYLGSSVQVSFQKPWIIITFSLLFVLMALSLFGLFNLQLPEWLRNKIAATSGHQKRGTYVGALVMGCLSTLILSPCVTPPLVAVLGYISHTGNALLGGGALFTMGIGMGVPLLLIGALGPKVLPKSGAWMNTVKNFMGILLLAIAVLMIERVIPPLAAMLLWAALSIGTALFLGALSTAKSGWMIVKKSVGLVFFVYSIMLIVGAYHGHTDPLSVLKRSTELNKNELNKLSFRLVNSVDQIHQILRTAALKNKPVMLDFAADWCIACKELDATTFSNPAVIKRLSHYVLLQADVTQNSLEDRMLEQHYDVIAPPTILFFKDGKEVRRARIIGYLPADRFLKRLDRVEK